MRNIIRFAIVPLILAIAGCATNRDMNAVRDDIDAVKTRLFSVEKDLGGVRYESQTGLGSMEKSFKSDVAAVRRIAADIQANIDSAKTETQLLNGRIDDLSVAIKKPADDLARFKDDADRRIIALQDSIMKLQSAVDALDKKTVEAAPVKLDALYMQGLEAFKGGDMPAARELFQKFLEQNPKHELAANAHYWIGETYYSEKEYEPAIVFFQDVIKNFPSKEKVPAAMLKQGMAFKAINDSKSAKYVLKKLTEEFPKSEESRKAKELLKGIR